MDFNFSCVAENCIDPASAFYFKGTSQRKVCDMHLPPTEEKAYPIASFFFITAPEDETEFYRRSEEVKQGIEFLRKILSQATRELEAALDSLDKARTWSLQVVNEVYEAEKRRTRQHFNQIKVFIEDFTRELNLYSFKKENLLSEPLDKLATELSVPSLLRVRTIENDLELAQVIMNSSSREELSFDNYLKALLNPKSRALRAMQLFQRAKKSSQTDSYLELQQAVEDCSESEALNPLSKTTQLMNALKVRIGTMKEKRESDLKGLIFQDPKSICSLLDVCSNRIPSQKAAGDNAQVERLYEEALKFALPESQSKYTLNILLSLAQCYTEPEQHKPRELMEVWKSASNLLTIHNPKSQETMNSFLQLGKLYQQFEEYPDAMKSFQTAVSIGATEFANTKDLADALVNLGMVYYLMKNYNVAEVHYQAAFQILNTGFQNSSEIATLYANLGSLYRDMNMLAEAQENYKLSVDILRSHFPSTYQLASTLIQMGHFYSLIEVTSEAEHCLNEAYEISSSKDFQDLKQQLLNEGYIPTGDVQKPIAVLKDQVRYFDVATRKWQQFCALRTNIKVNSGTSSTFIAPTTIFVCGGGKEPSTCHVENSAYLLQADGSVQELPHMSAKRFNAGVAWDSGRKALYVFGGSYGSTCYTDYLRTSEMFLSNEWSPLPNMHQDRSSFNPCWHSCLVYLCGGFTSSVETYDPRSNIFALLDFTLPEESATTAVVECGVLTVISETYISKLQQGKLTSQQHEYYYPLSSCTSVVYEGAVYIVALVSVHCCRCIDLNTGAVREEVSIS